MKRSGSILVANRGEIAVRIIRTAQQLGYRTVAVYSEADRGMPHALMADKSVCIGPAPAASSYLDVERVLDAAERTGATMIHPGYGFLSENGAFARACAAAEILFIGPSPEAIRSMGDKAVAKRIMLEAGISCIPGYEGAGQGLDTFIEEAERIGYPLMVKAVAGGGGKGIRLVDSPADLADAVQMARSEAEKAFANGQLMLEKAIVAPRHVEVQIFADSMGNAIHLGDRDCSIQRRHQKVIEEAPAPGIAPSVRQAMGEAAVRAAKAVDYLGAGTVEFLLDQSGNFYFLEMNTRLQVEHPVTEMVTGLDLVEWQIRIAQGEPLPLQQADVSIRGAAIEARLYAEDPATGYLPQSGRIEHWHLPEGDGIRVDHGLKEGVWVSTWYDPMIAKVIASGNDREEARRRLVRALEEALVVGLPTNRPLLLDCLEHPEFAAAQLSTDFIALNVAEFEARPPTDQAVALAAVLHWSRAARSTPESLRGWRSSGWMDQPVALQCGDWNKVVRLSCSDEGFRTRIEDRSVDVSLVDAGQGMFRATLDGIDLGFQQVWVDGRLTLTVDGQSHDFAVWNKQGASGGDEDRPSARAPMPGVVTSVRVSEGDSVKRGDVLLVMEAMKMETPIAAPAPGTVTAIHCAIGQQVAQRQVLVEIEPIS